MRASAEVESADLTETSGPPALSISHLAKAYGKTTVLRGVDLNVLPGEFLALAGANGAGKTTLIKTIVDLIRADAGHIAIFGAESTLVQARERLAYLPELFSAPRFLTGWQYLRYLKGLNRETYNQQTALELCQRVDLAPEALSRRVSEYSKGMTQKLGLIGALASDADLLILDEPMSGLDPKARYLLKRELRALRATGTTVFYSTHLLADAEDLCDRIAILDQGTLLFVGSSQACCAEYETDDLEEAYMRCIGESLHADEESLA
jgi:ABC-2 type transport system ATP-binding protein